MLGQGVIRALGTMSGTSLDGVDVAEVLTDGEVIEGFGESAFRPYSPGEQAVIRRALGCWPDDPGVAEAAEVVETAHAEALAPLAGGADLIGFHGQTLAHDPAGGRTHQVGDGGILAEVLGRPVVWDFRTADMRLGGQGAPLVPFFHFACARFIGARGPVAFLNLGGVGNLTWVDARRARPDSPGALEAFDTGPANAPVNDLMQARLGQSLDEGGALAAEGQADEDVLGQFLRHPYFRRLPPKSLDRNDFHDFLRQVSHLSDADAAATLTAAAAVAVAEGIEHLPEAPSQLLVTGGGRRNVTLMRYLAGLIDCAVVPVEDVGLNGDMLEAQAFAHLAVRVARGLPTSCPATTGVAASIGGGQISRPSRVPA